MSNLSIPEMLERMKQCASRIDELNKPYSPPSWPDRRKVKREIDMEVDHSHEPTVD